MQALLIKRPLLPLSLFALVCAATLACDAEQPALPAGVEELAERVALEAGLEQWEACVVEDDASDLPVCEDPLPEGPLSGAGGVLGPDAELSNHAVFCDGGCCFFWDTYDTDPHSEVTICCQTEHGAECVKY